MAFIRTREAFEAAEDSITIVDQSELGQVFEFRQNGVLIMIKVFPMARPPIWFQQMAARTIKIYLK